MPAQSSAGGRAQAGDALPCGRRSPLRSDPGLAARWSATWDTRRTWRPPGLSLPKRCTATGPGRHGGRRASRPAPLQTCVRPRRAGYIRTRRNDMSSGEGLHVELQSERMSALDPPQAGGALLSGGSLLGVVRPGFLMKDVGSAVPTDHPCEVWSRCLHGRVPHQCSSAHASMLVRFHIRRPSTSREVGRRPSGPSWSTRCPADPGTRHVRGAHHAALGACSLQAMEPTERTCRCAHTWRRRWSDFSSMVYAILRWEPIGPRPTRAVNLCSRTRGR